MITSIEIAILDIEKLNLPIEKRNDYRLEILHSGFELPLQRLAVITEEEIFKKKQ